MPAHSRELTVLGLLGATLLLPHCSELTKIDWSAIPASAGTSSGGMSTAAGAPATAGENPGEGGMAGAAGNAGESGSGGQGEGGDAESGGISAGGTQAGASAGGAAAAGGLLGGGGRAGGGNAGTGGNGGSATLHPTCSLAPAAPATPPNLAHAIVLFDGGAATNGDRGGRVGMDAKCKTAMLALGLPQSETHAVVSVSLADQIVDMPEHYKIPRKGAQVVSPLGIEFAASWDNAWGRAGTPNSLVCAGVMPPTVSTWLSGTSNATLGPDPLVPLYGAYEYAVDLDQNRYSHACNEWSFAANDLDVAARVGSTTAVNDGGLDGFPRFVRYLLVSCDAADDHLLCVAYDPER